MPSSRWSSWPRNQSSISGISCIAGRFFTHWAAWEAHLYLCVCLSTYLSAACWLCFSGESWMTQYYVYEMALFLWYLILSGFFIVKACWSSTLTLECTLSCSVAQLCPALCDPIDLSPPGSYVNGILQARILEWISTPFSRGSSGPKDWT